MRKEAEKEKHKLNAAYNNNVAVGLTIAGYWVPATAFSLNAHPIVQRFSSGGWGNLLASDRYYIVAIVAASAIALWSARNFRRRAMEQADLIED